VSEISPHNDDVRLTEALFRFGAALPARDDFEQDLYRECGTLAMREGRDSPHTGAPHTCAA